MLSARFDRHKKVDLIALVKNETQVGQITFSADSRNVSAPHSPNLYLVSRTVQSVH